MNRTFSIVATIALSMACMYGFYEIADDVRASEVIARFDAAVSARIQSFRSPSLDIFMKFMTYAGGVIGVTLLTFALFLYLRSINRVSDSNFTAVLVIGGTLLANMLKPLLKRVRPEEALAIISLPHSSSFPSGHSMGSMCLALAAIEAIIVAPTPSIMLKMVSVLVCVVYVVLVGISRVYLGVHWPSDVIAAWLLGGAWISAATGVQKLYLNVRVVSKQ